jgi:hypothetical protein
MMGGAGAFDEIPMSRLSKIKPEIVLSTYDLGDDFTAICKELGTNKPQD